MYRHLRGITRYTFEEAISSVSGPGVYLIYDHTGALLAVGESHDLRTRLKSHTMPSQRMLIDLLCSELAARHPKIGRCGSLILKKVSKVEREEAKRLVTDRVRKDFRVAILAGSAEDFAPVHERRQLEKFVQWVLQPTWGCWSHTGGIWGRIPENLDSMKPFEWSSRGK